MKKHAYLIKAHHQFGLLCKLLTLLDDERNDIYIHIGKGAKYDSDMLSECVKRSNLVFVPAVKEVWGGFSQIKSELSLFKEAVKGRYAYYHLLSGVDLPLKTQDEIHQFFENNAGKEFIYFCPQDFCEESHYKYEQYHFFQERVGRRQSGFWYQIERVSLFLQRRLGICRKNSKYEYAMGANWVSITHDLVEYLVLRSADIRKLFQWTLCCDEFLIQTMIRNSPFMDRVFSTRDDYYACLRLIDWKRGTPYVWRKKDYEELVKAPHLFARKFDEEIDSEVIDAVYEYVLSKQNKERIL